MNAPDRVNPLLRWPAKVNEVPKEVFDREDIYQQELKRIFYGPEWHPVAHAGEIPEPGDFKTIFIGEMPVLVVHGDDGKIRVFQNACSHRGNLLETRTCGNAHEFECPYHRWLFDSTGALRGAPNMDDFSPSFKQEDFGVPEIRSTEYVGMIFATLSDETPDIETFLGDVAAPLKAGLGGDGRIRLLGYQKVLYDCNWKIYIDNDGYHAPLLHKAFKLLNWQGGAGRQFATDRGHIGFVSELALPDVDKQTLLIDGSLIDFKGKDTSGSVIAAIKPITGVTKHLDMINIRFAFPRGLHKTEVHYGYFYHLDDDEEMIRHRVRQSSNMLGPSGLVSAEDASIFMRIQTGNQTPGNVTFQKGVFDERDVGFEFKQNDESGNLPGWEYYRKQMGFARQ